MNRFIVSKLRPVNREALRESENPLPTPDEPHRCAQKDCLNDAVAQMRQRVRRHG